MRWKDPANVPGIANLAHLVKMGVGARPHAYRKRTGKVSIAEKKFFDITAIALGTSSTWDNLDDATALSLSAIPQGMGESQRIGRTVHIKSINIRGFVNFASEEVDPIPPNQRFVRLALVQDMQTNQAQLAASAVFVNTAASTQNMSFRNLEFTDRFKVLGDKVIYFPMLAQSNEGGTDSFSLGPELVPFSFACKWADPGMKQVFDGTGATVADMTTNSLHLIGSSNNAACFVNYESRVRYFG